MMEKGGGALTLLHAAHVAELGLVLAVLAGAGADLQTVLLTDGARAALQRGGGREAWGREQINRWLQQSYFKHAAHRGRTQWRNRDLFPTGLCGVHWAQREPSARQARKVVSCSTGCLRCGTVSTIQCYRGRCSDSSSSPYPQHHLNTIHFHVFQYTLHSNFEPGGK